MSILHLYYLPPLLTLPSDNGLRIDITYEIVRLLELKCLFTFLVRILQQRRITPDSMGHKTSSNFGAK